MEKDHVRVKMQSGNGVNQWESQGKPLAIIAFHGAYIAATSERTSLSNWGLVMIERWRENLEMKDLDALDLHPRFCASPLFDSFERRLWEKLCTPSYAPSKKSQDLAHQRRR